MDPFLRYVVLITKMQKQEECWVFQAIELGQNLCDNFNEQSYYIDYIHEYIKEIMSSNKLISEQMLA